MQTQLTGTSSFRRDVAAQWWLNRVILVGSDSVVSWALQTYLRKEGYLATVTSEDLEGWLSLSLRMAFDRRQGIDPLAAAHQEGDVHLVIIAPSVTGARREALCRRLRSDQQSAHIPILALHDAGDAPKPPSVHTIAPIIARGGAAGHFGQASAVLQSAAPPSPRAADPREEIAGCPPQAWIDASLSWPFRLREVLSLVDQLLSRARSRSERSAV